MNLKAREFAQRCSGHRQNPGGKFSKTRGRFLGKGRPHYGLRLTAALLKRKKND